jgi:hypothetical protein
MAETLNEVTMKMNSIYYILNHLHISHKCHFLYAKRFTVLSLTCDFNPLIESGQELTSLRSLSRSRDYNFQIVKIFHLNDTILIIRYIGHPVYL